MADRESQKSTNEFLKRYKELPTSFSVLGEDYSIYYIDANSETLRDGEFAGLCDTVEKEIYISKDLIENDCEMSRNMKAIRKVLRHELMHAFYAESGLEAECPYASNEENIDWLASQWPKITKVMIDGGVLQKGEIAC